MRTSWKVGLATGARDPAPCAMPRTKVVLPAPSSPFNSTTSPVCSFPPHSLPTSSVAAGEVVVTSGKVVVSGAVQPGRGAAGVDDLDLAVAGERPNRLQACPLQQLGGAGAHELGLFAACQGVLDGGAGRARHVLGPEHTADSRHRTELLHLAHEAVRHVAAAQPELAEAAPPPAEGPQPVAGAFAPPDRGRCNSAA